MTKQHDEFWAGYLGVAPSDWAEPGVSIRSHIGLEGFRGVWFFTHLARTVVSAPAGWLPRLHSELEGVDAALLMEESFLRDLFGGDLDRLVGPAFHGDLDPSRFRPVQGTDVRFLGPEDANLVEEFQLECGSRDWEDSGLADEVRHVAASVSADRILSMAGYRARTDQVGDLCVLTHPAHRARGNGVRATSAVVERALLEGSTLLYQTLHSNVGAVRIASALGFDQYATHVAIRLSGIEPSNSR